MTLKIYGGCPAVFKAVLIRDRVLVFAYFDCISDRDRDELRTVLRAMQKWRTS